MAPNVVSTSVEASLVDSTSSMPTFSHSNTGTGSHPVEQSSWSPDGCVFVQDAKCLHPSSQSIHPNTFLVAINV